MCVCVCVRVLLECSITVEFFYSKKTENGVALQHIIHTSHYVIYMKKVKPIAEDLHHH